ncbi:Hypothetical predicted protein [Marmota monax]|uniref:Uncharacterized protein n=1 Tax=Marmota monax TaxID=9995 RepID=A0A5E4CHQ0_MARMO|nr:Hypothetical predicted protein [Marmota monax]
MAHLKNSRLPRQVRTCGSRRLPALPSNPWGWGHVEGGITGEPAVRTDLFGSGEAQRSPISSGWEDTGRAQPEWACPSLSAEGRACHAGVSWRPQTLLPSTSSRFLRLIRSALPSAPPVPQEAGRCVGGLLERSVKEITQQSTLLIRMYEKGNNVTKMFAHRGSPAAAPGNSLMCLFRSRMGLGCSPPPAPEPCGPSTQGSVSLVIYYSLLHPKSTDIWPGFVRTCRGPAGRDSAEQEAPPQTTAPAAGRPESAESCHRESWVPASVEKAPSPEQGPPGAETGDPGSREGSLLSRHHWLLVKLALKTGNVPKINAALGEDSSGCPCPPTWGSSQHCSLQGQTLCTQKAHLSSPHDASTLEKGSKFEGTPKAEVDALETSSYISFASDHQDSVPTQKPSATRGEDNPKERARAAPREQGRTAGGQLRGSEGQESTTLYFSATTEVAMSSPQEGSPMTLLMARSRRMPGESSPAQPPLPQPGAKSFPLTVANISPILGTGPCRHFRPSPGLPGPAPGGSEGGEWQEPAEALSHPAVVGTPRLWPQMSLRSAEEPRLTSTPKSEPIQRDCSCPARMKHEASFYI